MLMRGPARSRPARTRLRAGAPSLRVRAAAQAAAEAEPAPPGASAAASTSTAALTVVEVARDLSLRPALRFSLVALALAVVGHVGMGAATRHLRAHKVKASTTVATEVSAAEAPLAEDLLPPPPPPPAPPPPPSSTQAAPPTPSTSTAADAAPPSLLPAPGVAAAGSGGPAMAVAGGPARAASSTSALPATAATAQAAPPTLVPARPLSRPPPRYPADAQKRGVTGRVVLQIHVDVDGRVDDVRVVDADPAGVFDAAAIECGRGFTFAPATRDGAAVASWVRQTLRFTLEGT